METNVDQRDEHLETSLTPGQSCRQCPEGTYEKGTVTETLERGNTVVVVKDVPALVCDVCGNSLLAAEEVERLQSMLGRAEADGIEFQSRRYRPTPDSVENTPMTTADETDLDPVPREVTDPSELGRASQGSSSGDECIYCATGHFEPGTTTITLERKGTTLVVKQVPAQVCWACGEALLSEDVVDCLQDMMERTVGAEVETAVRPYKLENEKSSADKAISEVQEDPPVPNE